MNSIQKEAEKDNTGTKKIDDSKIKAITAALVIILNVSGQNIIKDRMNKKMGPNHILFSKDEI